MPHSVTSTSDISGIRKCTRKIRPRRKLAATPVAQIFRDGQIYRQNVTCGISVVSGTSSSAGVRGSWARAGGCAFRVGMVWAGPGADLGPDGVGWTGCGPRSGWASRWRGQTSGRGAGPQTSGRGAGARLRGEGPGLRLRGEGPGLRLRERGGAQTVSGRGAGAQTSGRGAGGQTSGRGAGGQTSGRGISGLVRRERSTGRAERMRDWMSSLTSQTLTFMPATTVPRESQKAMNSSPARSPR